MKHTIFFLIAVMLFEPAFADTVYMKNGKDEKGIVVEEYVDRIKLSTERGEIEILKKDIKDILYDLPAQNLIKLGDFHKEKGNTTTAYLYYRKAHETDPSLELARARYVQMQAFLLKQPDEQLEKSVEKKRALLEAQKGIVYTGGDILATDGEKLQKSVGVKIALKEGRPLIQHVISNSPAKTTGLKEGDYIIAIWNRLTAYMSLEEIYNAIINNPTGEINLTLERVISFKPKNGFKYSKGGIASLGFYINMTERGLTVVRILNNSLAFKKGLLVSDVITKISDKPTRYIPLKRAVNLIKSLGENCTITVERNVAIWKTGE